MPASSPPLDRGALDLRFWAQRLIAWVLDRPEPVPQQGQCCDRLRPSFARKALEQFMQDQLESDPALVDWRWEARSGEVRGVLLQNGELQSFRWSLRHRTMSRRPLLILKPLPHPAVPMRSARSRVSMDLAK